MSDAKNEIPFRESAMFPERITLCVGASVYTYLDNLKKCGVHVAQLQRDALSEYLEAHKDDLEKILNNDTLLKD